MRLFWLTLALALTVTLAIWGRRFEHLLFKDPPPPKVPELNKPQVPEFSGWESASANCALKLPPGSGWTRVPLPDQTRLSVRHGNDASFHISGRESRTTEITPAMIASAKADSKARSQEGGNRSEVVTGGWAAFRGVPAYQWIEKQIPPRDKSYFRTQLMFVRKGRIYHMMISSSGPEALKDPLIAPVVSALRFLDEK
jgi:hypothetical protein